MTQKEILMQEGKIVTIDGDRFKMSIPTTNQWDELEKFIQATPNLIQYIKTTETFMAYTLCAVGELIDEVSVDYFALGEGKKLYAAYSDYERTLYTNPEYANELVGFRPILIPLKKDGKPDETFAKQNPNGSIVYGGQVLVNQNAYGITHAPEQIPVENESCADVLTIVSQTNLEQDVIEWIVFNGMLFPTRTLAMTTINSMFQQDILPLIASKEKQEG